MNVAVGIVMLCIGLAMILLGRPRKGGDAHPFMNSHLMFATYPALILVFIAFGSLTILVNL